MDAGRIVSCFVLNGIEIKNSLKFQNYFLKKGDTLSIQRTYNKTRMNKDQPINVNGTKQRELRFLDLYKRVFPLVARYVSRMGGSLEQAKDVFQDALIIHYEKERSGELTLKTNEPAYLYGIARHLWIRNYKEGNKTTLLADNLESVELKTEEPSEKRILNYLEAAGQKCMQLLRAFYYDQLQLDVIAKDFGFSGTRSATVQKFKCLEKVREKVKEKSLVYEDFLD